MSKTKTGLLLFFIGWIFYIVCSVLEGIESTANVGSYLTLAAFVLEIIGLAILSKVSKNFKYALWSIILQLILAVVLVVLAVIAVDNASDALTTTMKIISYVIEVLEIVVIFSIIAGCAEVAPAVKGMAKVIEWIVTGVIVCRLVITIIADNATSAASALAIVAMVLALVYEIMMIIILARALKHVE